MDIVATHGQNVYMAVQLQHKPEDEQELVEQVLSFRYDPVGFVHFNFPWRQPGTQLEHHSGPRGWQANQLEDIAEHLLKNRERIVLGEQPMVYQDATRSGRGIGKSADVGMISNWFQSCFLGGSEIVTANNETQLKSRTMPEIRKWFSMGLNAHWFDSSALQIKPAPWFRELIEKQLKIDCAYYYLQAQLWSEENPDAFAGLHNYNGVLFVMDESSGIPRTIWDVSEGFFTEPTEGRFWLVYSNPRRNEGAFYKIFNEPGGYGDRWRTRHIDSRTVEGVDTQYLERMIQTHGEESNIVRVEILGEFPKAEDDRIIPLELVATAMDRDVERTASQPWVWGVDPGRFGDDPSAFVRRQGNHVEPIEEWRKLDTMQLVGRVKAAYDVAPMEQKPLEIMVDSIGIGAGVVDRLRELDLPAVGVNVSESPAVGETYLNLRAELWFAMLGWLRQRDCRLPDDNILKSELVSVGYEYTSSGKLKAESKEKMRKEKRPSPNRADALAMTFAGVAAIAMGVKGGTSNWNRPLTRAMNRVA